MKKFTLTLLRHGETSQPKNLNGATNISLSTLGYQQMERAISSSDHFEQIVTSPLERCHTFSHDLAHKRQWPITVDNSLREIDFGDWDGQAMKTLYQEFPQQLEQFWKTPWQFTPPNGETMTKFIERVDSAWLALLNQKKNSLVVCHSGVIRYLIAKTLGMPLPGNNHLISLDIGFAARVEIDVFIESDGKIWQTLKWPK